jgi:hypothetical protein
MPVQQPKKQFQFIVRCGAVLSLACLPFAASERLMAQAVDTNSVANSATQTNTVSTDEIPVLPVLPELVSTNVPVYRYSSAYQNAVLSQPQAYAEVPSATIGTGRLGSPIYGTSALTGPAPSAPLPSDLPGLWQSGEVSLHTILNETMLYGNGLEYTPGAQISSFVNEFTPSVILDAGRNWAFNYAPTFYDYSSDKFHDTVSQSESMRGATYYQDWQFGLTQSYAAGSQPLVETGEQTSTEVITGGLDASRQLGNEFAFSVNLGWDYRGSQQFNTIETWSGGAGLYYTPLPQISYSLSLSGGYDITSLGSDIVFESVEAGMTFRPGRKLVLSFSGGAQEMQFVDPSAPSLLSPVFYASLLYKATQSTSVSLNAAETVTPSFFGNQVITTTSVSASLQQNITPKLSFIMSGGYSWEPYTSIEISPLPQFYLGVAPRSVLETVRKDTFESLNLRLNYLMTRRITGSVFYTLSENSSEQSNFKYTSLQEGLSISYVF